MKGIIESWSRAGPGGMVDGVQGLLGWALLLVLLLLWIGLLALVVWTMVRVTSATRGDGGRQLRRDPSEELLRERFARVRWMSKSMRLRLRAFSVKEAQRRRGLRQVTALAAEDYHHRMLDRQIER